MTVINFKWILLLMVFGLTKLVMGQNVEFKNANFKSDRDGLKAAKKNGLSEGYIKEIEKKKAVYYPFLSEYYRIYAYFWVKSRAKKSQ